MWRSPMGVSVSFVQQCICALTEGNHQLFIWWGCVTVGRSVIRTQRFFRKDVLGSATSKNVNGISTRSGLCDFFFSPINLHRANTSLLALPTEAFCSDTGPVRTDETQWGIFTLHTVFGLSDDDLDNLTARPRACELLSYCHEAFFAPPLLALGIVRSYEIRISYFWIALLLIWTCMLRGYYSSGFKMYLPPSCLVQFVNDISISAANGSWFLFPLWPTGQVRLVTVPFSCYFLRCKAGKSASLLSALLVGGHH